MLERKFGLWHFSLRILHQRASSLMDNRSTQYNHCDKFRDAIPESTLLCRRGCPRRSNEVAVFYGQSTNSLCHTSKLASKTAHTRLQFTSLLTPVFTIVI